METLTFDSDIKVRQTSKYFPKLEEGTVVAVGFPNVYKGAPKIITRDVFELWSGSGDAENIKFVAPTDKELLAACEAKWQVKQSWGVVALIYTLDQNDDIVTPVNGYFCHWFFKKDKYNPLKKIHKQFSLADHDVEVTCTNTDFKKVTMAPMKEAAWKTMPEQVLVKEEAEKMFSTLEREMARVLTEQEIGALLANRRHTDLTPIPTPVDVKPFEKVAGFGE